MCNELVPDLASTYPILLENAKGDMVGLYNLAALALSPPSHQPFTTLSLTTLMIFERQSWK